MARTPWVGQSVESRGREIVTKRFTVIGDGAMGTATAILLAQRPEFDVTMWCQFAENADAMMRDRENRRFLPGVAISDRIKATGDFEQCRDADAFILAVPMVYLSKTLDRLSPRWVMREKPTPVVSVIKGIEQGTFRRASEIIAQYLPGAEAVAFSGPMHAEELAQGMYASIVAASPNLAVAEEVQHWFSSDRLRVYTSSDLIGTELGGALKNVIAIAAGICDGAKYGDNAKSALMTRGLVEMIRLGVALGARPETFYGLAGLGDLITTSVSPHGRNRRVGERLGRGEKMSAIIGDMVQVAEGVWTAKSVHELSRTLKIDMPVTTEIYQILFEDEDVEQAVHDLMHRPLSSE